MHVVVEYTEEAKTPFQEEFFQKVALRTLQECQFSFLQGKEVVLNVISITSSKIRELNMQYRSKDAVTDILSFGEYESTEQLSQEAKEEIFLGEILFCSEFIETSAKEDGETLERELSYVFSHGVLHLVGFDHEEEMFAIQDTVTGAFTQEK
jgi:probable rRNA maturation factor